MRTVEKREVVAKIVDDPELVTLWEIVERLSRLSEAQAMRVVSYLDDRFGQGASFGLSDGESNG